MKGKSMDIIRKISNIFEQFTSVDEYPKFSHLRHRRNIYLFNDYMKFYWYLAPQQYFMNIYW